MASAAPHGRRLDATERDVVYCHACSFEWYREEYGLECPSCESDITELVSLENDPRPAVEDYPDGSEDFDDVSVHASVAHRDVHEDDSDPEVADIDDLDSTGLGYAHSTESREHANHHEVDETRSVQRFIDIVSTIGLPFGAADSNGNLTDRVRQASQNRQERIEWTNGTSQGSVTFYSTLSGGPFVPGEDAPPGFEPFSTIFTSAFRDFGAQLAGGEQGSGNRVDLTASLEEIMNLINHGVHGDAVYSEEGLARVASMLMDEDARMGSAPPASEQGLANLPRRTIDKDLKNDDGNTECPICIDGMKAGEVAVSLPCNHSFHEQCAVAWLKEHNTCPVCRAPMEGNAGGRNTAEDRQEQPQNRNDGQNPHRRGQRHVPTPTNGQSSSAEPRSLPNNGSTHMPAASGSSRPPNQSQTRINEAMRYLSSQHGERDRPQGPSVGFSYDTSRLQRRSSMSPTSPRVATGGGAGGMRERSPSQGRRRTVSTEDSEEDNAEMRWLRGRFVGGNSRP